MNECTWKLKMDRMLRMSLAIVFILSIGCDKLTTDYGTSKGMTGRTSLNGFGALRSAYEQSGFDSRDVSRLTNRVSLSDVIVWTPKVNNVIDDKVTNWFERWLARGGKTLVYIVPDSGSEADYWTEAGQFAPPEQRMEYRKRSARAINERMTWRLNRDRWTSNGWFQIQPLSHRDASPIVAGPWRSSLSDDGKPAKLTSEFFVSEYRSPGPNAKPTPGGVAAAGPALNGPTGPGANGVGSTNFLMGGEVTTSQTKTKFRSLVRNAKAETIVAAVKSDAWKDSQIIVVGGGSLLTNFAMAHDVNQRLAGQLITASVAPIPSRSDAQPMVGFLVSDGMQISVSETKPGVPSSSGMELLTVWPLSLVTMHGVMLGLVICLMLLPIFGRPQKVHVPEHTDFGDHLDAVAGLMTRVRGEDYARERVSEYFKRIRGETSGPWVIADPIEARDKAVPLPPLRTLRREIPPTTQEPSE